MTDGISAEWTGRRALVAFPEHVDSQIAAELGEHLLTALSGGARLVIADMSRMATTDPACSEMLIRVYQSALLKQAELRLVTGTPAGAELVAAAGLDRLVSVFPSAQAAASGDGRPDGSMDSAGQAPQPPPALAAAAPSAGDNRGQQPGLSTAVLRQLIDALDDGILLADADGTIVLASRRLAAMFGYSDGELAGLPVEVLVPARLREIHRKERADYERHPVSRPMAHRIRLAGVRKDGATRPVTITLSPVPTATGHLTLAVIRDATQSAQQDDLASLAWAAAAEQDHQTQKLHNEIVTALFKVGISLEAAADQPSDVARDRITEALTQLDHVVHQVRDHQFRARPNAGKADNSHDKQ